MNTELLEKQMEQSITSGYHDARLAGAEMAKALAILALTEALEKLLVLLAGSKK